MRDPTVNADVEAAIEAACSVFDRHPEYLQPLPSVERLNHLHQLAAAGLYVMQDKTIPEDIRMIICDLVLGKVAESGGRAGPRRQGRYVKGAFWRRDLRIAQAVALIVERGFLPTRNDASRTNRSQSACSIVSTALKRRGVHMSDRTLEDIWNNVRIDRATEAIWNNVGIERALLDKMTAAQLDTAATCADRKAEIVWEYLQELHRSRRRQPDVARLGKLLCGRAVQRFIKDLEKNPAQSGLILPK
jgi:hypothetical protein